MEITLACAAMQHRTKKKIEKSNGADVITSKHMQQTSQHIHQFVSIYQQRLHGISDQQE
jgi:hypothetical protein